MLKSITRLSSLSCLCSINWSVRYLLLCVSDTSNQKNLQVKEEVREMDASTYAAVCLCTQTHKTPSTSRSYMPPSCLMLNCHTQVAWTAWWCRNSKMCPFPQCIWTTPSRREVRGYTIGFEEYTPHGWEHPLDRNPPSHFSSATAYQYVSQAALMILWTMNPSLCSG